MRSLNPEFRLTALASAVTLSLLFNTQVQAEDVIFSEVTLPLDDQTAVTVSDEVTVGDEPVQSIGFTELFRTGDEDNGEVYGLMKDYLGNPAVSGTGVPYICSGNTSGVAGSGTDFSALLEKHGKTYLISQFECQTGGMYMAEVKQNGAGMLSPVPGTLQFIDQHDEWGGWVHCAGSVTPWNTYLGGEEYEPNAALVEGEAYPTSDPYYNDKVRSYWLEDASKSSPYHNGWITEVDVNKKGKAKFQKHYAMGRFSHELGYVMPDGKTAYLTDDGTNDTLFMFVAEEKGDLSKGTLYAAKWNQTSGFGGGSAQLEWINLGKASNKMIKQAIKDGISFSDMFNVYERDENGICLGGTELSTNEIRECIEVKEGMEKLASRLESRRYAALLGATYEFRKMEGVTFDPNRNVAYIAISEVGRAMLDNTLDPEKLIVDETERNYDDRDGNGVVETGNHIRVEKADYCGAVYAMDVMSGVRDSDGKKIKSKYVTINMNSILASGTAGGEISPEECALNDDIMAQPDNIAMVANSDSLIIGEDGKHENNMVWSFDLDSHELTRIATVPLGAETTSPYIHEVGDYSYMTLVAQHPDSSPDNPYGDSITGIVGPMQLVEDDGAGEDEDDHHHKDKDDD